MSQYQFLSISKATIIPICSQTHVTGIPIVYETINEETVLRTVHGYTNYYPCTGGSHGKRTCGACMGGARSASAATRKISSA